MSRHGLRHRLCLLNLLSATAISLAAFCLSAPAYAAASCEELANLKLPDTTIESAKSVPADDLTTEDKIIRKAMPAFCRVAAAVKAEPDSDIRVEIWLPMDQWKKVFHGNGNGGYSGIVSFGYDGMEAGVKAGYASASTDMGTAPATPLNGDALVGHPQKWKEWGLTSTHVMTVVGKEIEKAFYGEEPKHSYFTGCSTGGQQALIEAQYYPTDYDGILAGAPVVSRTWGHAAVLWDYLAANLQQGHKLSDAKLSLLTKSAVAACGAKSNGLKSDAFIADPGACDFDPSALTCKGADSAECLTPAEVETAKAFYSGPVDSQGKHLYYGWPPGSEAGSFNWGFLEAPANAPGEPSFDGLFKWVFGANWNWRDFNFDQDMAKVDTMLGPVLNGAVTGDVSSFHTLGGKLLIYQGWADPVVAPDQTIALYKNLAHEFGGDEEAGKFTRLFMAPGVGHCGGGAGPNSFNSALFQKIAPPSTAPEYDALAALAQWVEEGKAPSQIIATKYVDDDPGRGVAMQRPLCPYPQRPWYKGTGETKDAASFACAVSKP
jgi:feruloyl esterase